MAPWSIGQLSYFSRNTRNQPLWYRDEEFLQIYAFVSAYDIINMMLSYLLSLTQRLTYEKELNKLKGRKGLAPIPDVIGYEHDEPLTTFGMNLLSSLAAMSGFYQLVCFFIWYFFLIFMFALLFSIDMNGISFPDDMEGGPGLGNVVWFSMQAFSTIGFGAVYPRSHYINFIVVLESFVSLVFVAVLSAIFVSNLLSPQPMWKVSEVCTIYRNESTGNMELCMRVVFAPGAVYAECCVTADVEIRMPQLVGGGDNEHHTPNRLSTTHWSIRTLTLDFQNNKSLFKATMWQPVHIITPDSPIHDIIETGQWDRLMRIKVEVSAMCPVLKAHTSTLSVYTRDDVMLNQRFVPMAIVSRDSGNDAVHASFLNKTELSTNVLNNDGTGAIGRDGGAVKRSLGSARDRSHAAPTPSSVHGQMKGAENQSMLEPILGGNSAL